MVETRPMGRITAKRVARKRVVAKARRKAKTTGIGLMGFML
jgi:hypothetical protein